MNKHGINLFRFWAEYIGLFLLVIGFALALTAGSKVMAYIVVTIAGMMFGRLWYRVKHSFKFTWFVITLGFILGFVLGNFYGSDMVVIILFLVSLLASYYLHDSQVIKSSEY